MTTKILIPMIEPADALPHLRLAIRLLSPEGKILALKVVRVPEESSLSEGAAEALNSRAVLEELRTLVADERIEPKTLVRVSHRLSSGIAETAKDESCDLLILPWKGYAVSEERLFGATIDRLMEHSPCNTVVARVNDLSGCARILLPIRGGPHAEFALELAGQLAVSLGGEITVLHCEQRFTEPDFGEWSYRFFIQKLGLHPHVKRLLAVQGDPRSIIIEEARRHDLIILGAGARTEPHAFFLGPIVAHIAQATEKPLLVVKTPRSYHAWAREGPLEMPRSLSETVDKWFAENTFHRKEFEDLTSLLKLKEKQGVSISLGLPALNEAETVGNIIQTVKEKLFDEAPLLDEIVLIDSGSTDDTVAIAKDLGIPVYVHQEILHQYGSYRGKGEALWKSLHVLSGDIIIWIDTDIKNIHPGFVYGILGPLLKEPEIRYVKGFYRRPLKVEGRLLAEGGGRVTELTVRPFLNLFFPQLSGIVQPLAGEYGGRREALERVPFFTGYGVETGLLIDLFNEFGLRSVAQVDLEERIHRNQPLAALSQMSFAIIQVFIERLEGKSRIKLIEDVNRSMKLIKHQRRGYALEVKEIRDQERPPMISIPEYRAARRETLSLRERQRL
ncbi:MAG: glucosyl-3-phosphoglycerate synthase [Deltaproteobacteria bacterium]|nr:glucosyl-3-phosphoglycerate synthase [Deltaproteobacteria bacterium]